jgi:hypothetical protein
MTGTDDVIGRIVFNLAMNGLIDPRRKAQVTAIIREEMASLYPTSASVGCSESRTDSRNIDLE